MEERFAKLSISEATPVSDESSLKAKYNKLVLDAKERARQGQLDESLRLFQSAYDIHKSEKLERRIAKLKNFLKEYEQQDEEENEEVDEDEDGLVDIGNGYKLAYEVKEALYPYQIEALQWFWSLFKKKKGGILGDDMGLGKTIQVIAFLSGMFDCNHIRSALIVMPVAVVENWEKEFNKWTPGIRVKCFHGSTKKERLTNLHKIQHKSGVCLTTYGMVVSNYETLSQDINGHDFKWDYIILDEGHKIKNPTKTSKGIRAIPAKHHFILTGTPIQNNLKEMWSLFDFVCQGQLLGTLKTFKTEFETPIVRARERDARAYEMKIGNEMSKTLRKLIEPHFLRRTKAEVLNKKNVSVTDTNTDGPTKQNTVSFPKMLSRKNDFIVWLHLSEAQLKIYVDFLKLDEIKELLMSTRSPLAELNVLKKICDHPRLLSSMACSKLGLDENARIIDLDDDGNNENIQGSSNQEMAKVSDATIIQESGKMMFLVSLLDTLKAEGHRCLVFSQSRKMLDMIQRVITHRGHKVLRIDGTIRSTAEREHLITTFQTNSSYNCFLLTTQVGGVGLTLTAADRVVIFDPSWNPATDAQAVDRAYRIGQTRNVVIYRLITCGSIEEKIYRKQVFKNALSQQTTGSSKNPFRYFTSQDLRELFTLDDPSRSKTQIQLSKMHAKHRKTDDILDKHVEFLHTLGIFGLSDHDLIYSQEAIESQEELEQSSTNHDAIQARVLRVQNMVAAESNGEPTLHRVLPAPYENPKSLLKPINLENIANENIKAKIQTQIHNFEVFKPKREDTKRFQPQKVKTAHNPTPAPETIDLSTPPASPCLDSNPINAISGDVANLSIAKEFSPTIDSGSSQSDSSYHSYSNEEDRETSSLPPNLQDNREDSALIEVIPKNTALSSTPTHQNNDFTDSSMVQEQNRSNDLSINRDSEVLKTTETSIENQPTPNASKSLSLAKSPEVETAENLISRNSLSNSIVTEDSASYPSLSKDSPNFCVDMFSNDKDEAIEGKADSSLTEDENVKGVVIEPNDIFKSIFVASPVVYASDKPQTPRRKSSAKNRRKSVSQTLFNKSDSEDSDNEVVTKPKTARRVRKIESDDEEESSDSEHSSESGKLESVGSSDHSEQNQSEGEKSLSEYDGSQSSNDDILSHTDKTKDTDDKSVEEDEFLSSTHSGSLSDASDSCGEVYTRKTRVRGVESSDESDRDSFEKEDFVCPNQIHTSSAVKIQRCECVLSQYEKDSYRDLLASARNEKDKYAKLGSYLEALKIQSSDIQVHKEAILLAKHLNIFEKR